MTGLFWFLLLIVLLIAFGGAIFVAAWFVLWYALVGLVAGAFARLLVRQKGPNRITLPQTILAGLIGSLSGGWIANALDLSRLVQIIVAILVAAVVVAAVSARGSTSSK